MRSLDPCLQQDAQARLTNQPMVHGSAHKKKRKTTAIAGEVWNVSKWERQKDQRVCIPGDDKKRSYLLSEAFECVENAMSLRN